MDEPLLIKGFTNLLKIGAGIKLLKYKDDGK